MLAVTATKVWVEGPTVKLDVELHLHCGDVAKGTPVTLRSGTTTYTPNLTL